MHTLIILKAAAQKTKQNKTAKKNRKLGVHQTCSVSLIASNNLTRKVLMSKQGMNIRSEITVVAGRFYSLKKLKYVSVYCTNLSLDNIVPLRLD